MEEGAQHRLPEGIHQAVPTFERGSAADAKPYFAIRSGGLVSDSEGPTCGKMLLQPFAAESSGQTLDSHVEVSGTGALRERSWLGSFIPYEATLYLQTNHDGLSKFSAPFAGVRHACASRPDGS